MMDRRALVAGVACVGGALLARQLKPHKYVSLLGSAKLDDLIPRSFGGWVSEDAGDPLALNGPGTLSSKLYNQVVTRIYSNPTSGQRIWVLLAHGERQSDELQLHRPEVCYPAFGYALLRNEATPLTLAQGVAVPSRRLLAKSPSREERVVYWTRLGEFLPVDANEQRVDRFQNAMAGIIPDGLLCRFSTADPGDPAWTDLQGFVSELVHATAPTARRVLIGSARAQALGQQRA